MRARALSTLIVAVAGLVSWTPLTAQYVKRGTLACLRRDMFERYAQRIMAGDTSDIPLEARINCVRWPRSSPVAVAERTQDGLGVHVIEDGKPGRSVWWIATGSLVEGEVPASERNPWPDIMAGPRIKKGTVVCSSREGIEQAANLIARGDTSNLTRRTPFFCYHMARDDSVLVVVVRADGFVAYRGYPRDKAILTWVRAVDVVDLENLSASQPTDSLSLISFTVTPVTKNASAGVYRNSATLTLTVRNNTNQPVAAWRATLVVVDPFGDELFRTQVTNGKASIAPGMIGDASFRFEDNEFIKDEAFDKLIAYDASKLELRLAEIRVVH